MNTHAWKYLLLGAALLQGCASTPATQADVKLFAPDGSARFNLYVACSSHTASCRDAEQQFAEWAASHQVAVHFVKPGDKAIRPGAISPANDETQPYRVAISYRPDVTDTSPTTFANRAGNVYQPWVSYQASIAVYDARTGQPARRAINTRDGVGLEYGWSAIDACLAGFARDVIVRVDPSYATETASSR